MIYRCKELGILSTAQVSYLYRQLSAKGMRKREPLDTAFKTEAPSILMAALDMLIEHRVRTKAEIVDALTLNSQDIEMLCGTEKGFFGETVVQLRLKPNKYA